MHSHSSMLPHQTMNIETHNDVKSSDSSDKDGSEKDGWGVNVDVNVLNSSGPEMSTFTHGTAFLLDMAMYILLLIRDYKPDSIDMVIAHYYTW